MKWEEARKKLEKGCILTKGNAKELAFNKSVGNGISLYRFHKKHSSLPFILQTNIKGSKTEFINCIFSTMFLDDTTWKIVKQTKANTKGND